jgi:phosphopantetheine--protein transferase-like protein
VTELSARTFSVSDPQLAPRGEQRLYLGEQDVDIWLCSHDRVANSDEFKRRVLSRYAEVVPADWQFAIGEHGKPCLVDAAHALDFNLSHSGDWLACAVTAGAPVGVDIEACKPKRDVMTLARRFFREEEVASLESCDSAGQRDQFYDFWTLKESAVKARGGVLVSGLDTRGFALTYKRGIAFEQRHIALTTPDEVVTAQYCLLDPSPGYRLAICWLPAAPLQPQLRVFELCESGVCRTINLPLRASTWLD